MEEHSIVWAACLCKCWPLTPLYGIGRCARCGERPQWNCKVPDDGRAYDL